MSFTAGVVKIHSSNTKVAITSVTRFQPVLRIAGAVQKIARVPELSSLWSYCSLNAAQHRTAPMIPPSN